MSPTSAPKMLATHWSQRCKSNFSPSKCEPYPPYPLSLKAESIGKLIIQPHFAHIIGLSAIGILEGSKNPSVEVSNIFTPRIDTIAEVYQGWTRGCEKSGQPLYVFDPQTAEQRGINSSPKYSLLGHDSLKNYLKIGNKYETAKKRAGFFNDKIVSIKPAEEDK